MSDAGSAALFAHLAGGSTTVCRAWALTRADGLVLGFTDHDRDLVFEGITFAAGSGLAARALAQGTGLAVDTGEAGGALSAAAITEADVMAGRYDGADLRAWLVNWADVSARHLQMRGTLGELRRAGGAFSAELRGLSAALNRGGGRVYMAACGAVLGDGRCGVDLSAPGYRAGTVLRELGAEGLLRLDPLPDHADRWFEKGRLTVLDGPAAGLWGVVKNDRATPTGREVELWVALRADLRPGDRVELRAGCDRRAETCRLKFDNLVNFRGFPHVPGEDWLTVAPVKVAG